MDKQQYFAEVAERLNQVRLARASAILSLKQRHLLQLIPLLFHYNRNDYPGYNGPMTPAGICQYAPNDQTIKACQALELAAPIIDVKQNHLYGVYSMGSTGSFGQHPNSDIDVWVIYDPILSKNEYISLEQKSILLTAWFSKHDIDVNIYLVRPDKFWLSANADSQLAAIGCENSGSSQHWLLLEEFYRSHICLAGKRIAWWPQAEAIDTHLSLGDISNLPASEYFGASLWQLYKGLDKPHKALLKVMLLEAYASDYPNTQLVTSQIWQRTLAGDFSALNDNYFLLYQSIERYLMNKQDKRRLEIVRRCFYLKCGIKLSLENQPKDWRYHKLQTLVVSWGWSQTLLVTLDQCESWHSGQLQWFNEQLNKLLLDSYQTLLKFASVNKLDEKFKIVELGLLTRKLHSHFGQNDEQVLGLNRFWGHSIAEPYLTIIYSYREQEYYLYRCQPDPKAFRCNSAIYHAANKAKLLIWATLNEISTVDTCWYEFNTDIGQNQPLIKATHRLPDIIKDHHYKASKLALCSPWYFRQLIFLINLNFDPNEYRQDIVDHLDGNIFSSKSNSAKVTCVLDVICHNSWGEWHCHHFDGDEAILDALVYITPGMRRTADEIKIDVINCSHQISHQFELAFTRLCQRVNSLATQAQNSSTIVYPLQIGKARYGLFFDSNGMVYQDLCDAKAFYQQLSKQQPLKLPRPELGNDPLSKIPEVVQDFVAIDTTQYFLRQNNKDIDVFVLDEKNKLEHFIQPGTSIDELVSRIGLHYAFSEAHTGKEHFDLPQFFKLLRIEGRLQALPFGINIDEAKIEF